MEHPTELSQHPVIQLIKERAKEGSKPWSRTDGAKVGIVVEGGALRAVASAAELVALHRMGYRDCLDTIYGESVGAGNAAYFRSGQIDTAIATYYELVNNLFFVNPLRVLTGTSMVSIHFLNKQLETHYPYNYAASVDTGIELNVLITRADRMVGTQKCDPLVVINQFDDKADLLEALTTAVWMPFFCGEPYSYRRMKGWDAGIIDKFPVQRAIEDGCTHILALSSSPDDYVPKDSSLLGRTLITNYFNRHNPDLGQFYLATKAKFRNTLDFLRAKQETQDGPPYVATIALPAGIKRLSTFEMRGRVLRQTAALAEAVTYQAFR